MTNLHKQLNRFLRSASSFTPALLIAFLFVAGIQTANAQLLGGNISGVKAQQLTVAPVSLPNRITGCDGASITLDAGNSFNTYSWSTGDTTSSITVTTAGVYSVNVMDAMGNSSSDLTQVDFLQHFTPTIYSTDNGNTNFSFWTGGTPGATSWIWDFGDGYGSTNSVTSHSFANAGPDTICVWVTNQCFTETACVVINNNQSTTSDYAKKGSSTQPSLDNVLLESYPNPSTTGVFFIRHGKMNEHYRVTDLGGHSVLDMDELPDEYGEIRLDLSDFNSGMYILSAFGNGQVSHSRLVISKE